MSLLQHWGRDIFDWGVTRFIGREPEGESAAFLQFAAHGYFTIMDEGKPLYDAEAKTAAPHFAAACFVGAIETVKDMGLIFGADADARIADGNFDPAVRFLKPQGDDAAIGGIFDGIVRQVEHDLAQAFTVAIDKRLVFTAEANFKRIGAAPLLRHASRLAINIEEQGIHFNWLALQLQRATVHLCQCQEVSDHGTHARGFTFGLDHGLLQHAGDLLGALRVVGRCGSIAPQEVEVALYGRQGSAQFVANIGDEPFLGLEELLDAVQHFVEGRSQLPHFAGVIGNVKAAAEVFGAANDAGGVGDGIHRGEGTTCQEGAANGRQNEGLRRCR